MRLPTVLLAGAGLGLGLGLAAVVGAAQVRTTRQTGAPLTIAAPPTWTLGYLDSGNYGERWPGARVDVVEAPGACLYIVRTAPPAVHYADVPPPPAAVAVVPRSSLAPGSGC
jgi:hypothetical protein